jgi:hypothetical protein
VFIADHRGEYTLSHVPPNGLGSRLRRISRARLLNAGRAPRAPRIAGCMLRAGRSRPLDL